MDKKDFNSVFDLLKNEKKLPEGSQIYWRAGGEQKGNHSVALMYHTFDSLQSNLSSK